jgi:hypothetical protein
MQTLEGGSAVSDRATEARAKFAKNSRTLALNLMIEDQKEERKKKTTHKTHQEI